MIQRRGGPYKTRAGPAHAARRAIAPPAGACASGRPAPSRDDWRRLRPEIDRGRPASSPAVKWGRAACGRRGRSYRGRDVARSAEPARRRPPSLHTKRPSLRVRLHEVFTSPSLRGLSSWPIPRLCQPAAMCPRGCSTRISFAAHQAAAQRYQLRSTLSLPKKRARTRQVELYNAFNSPVGS